MLSCLTWVLLSRVSDFGFWRMMAESGFTQQEGSLPLVPLTDLEDYMVSECPYESPDLHNDSMDSTEDQRVFTVLDTPDRSRLCVDDLARLPDLFACLGSKGHSFQDMGKCEVGLVWFGLLGFNTSATARVIPRW